MNEKVKQALENVKNIKVGSMTLNDLFGEDLKVIENALNDFDKYHESQQDLIKGKDEYIAKLCNDRARFHQDIKNLGESLRLKEIETNELKGRCNILEQELNDLREFAKIVATKGVAIGFIQLLEKENAGGVNEYNDYIGGDKNFYLTEAQFNFVKKVVEKYGK